MLMYTYVYIIWLYNCICDDIYDYREVALSELENVCEEF